MYLSACIYARFFSFLPYYQTCCFPSTLSYPSSLMLNMPLQDTQQPIMVINDAIFTTQYKNMLSLDALLPLFLSSLALLLAIQSIQYMNHIMPRQHNQFGSYHWQSYIDFGYKIHWIDRSYNFSV